MSSKIYLPRITDKLLDVQLKASGAVLIEGAKWCGKTSTARKSSNSVLYMQDPDYATSNIKMADTKPSLLLKGDAPRLIDEWQMAPVLWDAVRFEVDKRGLPGQFILTGSAVPSDGVTAHTGTGRISRLLMRPMSLYESGDSTGVVSLHDLFNEKQQIDCVSSLNIEQIAYLICRGGWPAAIKQEPETALQMATNYVEAVINMDVQRVDNVDKNPQRVRMLLRSLARNISTLASYETIKNDIEATDTSISEKTIASYLNALRRIFVVEDLPAWQPSLRSKTAIRTSHKRHFVDPSIATAVLRADPESILADFELFGFLFEALCTRDIRIYAQANDGDVFHYRDKSELEADMIVALRDGRWAAIEVKLGSTQIEQAAQNLIRLQERIDTAKMNKPSFLMVLTAGQYAYQRPDGVIIMPIGCLKD